MTTTKTIPLNNLRPWEGNVRKTEGSDTALAELAASIASIGLIQPLSVRKGRGNGFEVVAGARRLAALKTLVKGGTLTADHRVPCTVIAEDANATEISLAENAVREDMHPADQFEAFRKLAASGLPAADIAARFGVTERVVLARLKLANVSPVIVKAYREDEISLEIVMAFAVTDDQKAQEKLWKATPKYHRQAYSIRRALTETEITASDRRVKVVGLKAYEKAGGKTRTDLFTEGEEGVFILDAGLLSDLFNARLESAAAKVRAEGWKWVELRETFEHGKFRQLEQEYAALPAKDQKKLDALTEDREQLEAEDASWDDIDEVQEKIDAINEAREELWSAASLAIAGAVIYVDYHGKVQTQRGLIRPEDEKKRTEKANGKAAGEDKAEAEDASSGLSAKLAESLTQHRSAALSAALMKRPGIALAATVHAIASAVFCGQSGKSCVHVSIRQHSFNDVEGCPAEAAITEERKKWSGILPGTPDKLWAWCLAQETQTLIELLAFCAANSVDAVIKKHGSMDFGTSMEHAGMLAEALDLDMTQWFTPTAANYFSHVSKAQILQDLQAAKGQPAAPAWEKAKKAELAVIAERQTAGTGWLPDILRGSAQAG